MNRFGGPFNCRALEGALLAEDLDEFCRPIALWIDPRGAVAGECDMPRREAAANEGQAPQ
jgi:hypothetical protein